MASQGPNNPSSRSSAGAGTAWTGFGNTASSDNSYATITLAGGASSQYLKGISFGFSIPGGATINGIVVEVEKTDSGEEYVRDQEVKLYKNNTLVGTNKADTVSSWPATDTYKTYGGSTDLWGTTWTDTDINAAGFGIGFKVINNSVKFSALQAKVDHIRITIYYTTGSGSSITSKTLLVNE